MRARDADDCQFRLVIASRPKSRVAENTDCRVAGGHPKYAEMGICVTVRRTRLREWIAALALFGVLLRGLIPVGFMPVAVVGGTQLMFCHGADPHPSRHSGTQGVADSHCAFALSSSGAPTPETITTTVTATPDAPACYGRSSTALNATPARHCAPRGPPAAA